MIKALLPGIYRLKYNEKSGYYLEFNKPRFVVTGKNYGDMDKEITTFWSRYNQMKSSMGVLLTGAAGSGKTRVAEILSNLAIDIDMCIVMVNDVRINIELVPFIDSLYNMVIVFDEFSKNIPYQMQNKMLTMFSSIGNNKKLFILTENDRNSVSPFIRNRPGRIRYAVNYDRIPEDVILEYCDDYNISDEMLEDILTLHSKAAKFTFDHLQALVSESSYSPGSTIEELLILLNLDDLTRASTWNILDVIDTTTNDHYSVVGDSHEYTDNDMDSNYLVMRFSIAKNGDDSICKSISFPASKVDRITKDNVRVYVSNDFEIYIGKSKD